MGYNTVIFCNHNLIMLPPDNFLCSYGFYLWIQSNKLVKVSCIYPWVTGYNFQIILFFFLVLANRIDKDKMQQNAQQFITILYLCMGFRHTKV